MYNQELKERYWKEKVTYTTTAPYHFSALFKRTEPFETELDKDISNFSTYEIINMYKTLSISSINTIANMNSSLSLYTQWCIQENLVADFQNHFLEIDREMMGTFINKIAMDNKVVSRQTVLGWCGNLPNPSDSFILLALFEGAKGAGYQEITKATINDFDDNTLTLYTGRKIKVSDELIEYAKESNETLIYYSMTKAMEHTSPLVENGRIIKDYPSVRKEETQQSARRRTMSKLTRAFEYLGINNWMTGTDIRMSGMIYLINLRSKELGITGREYIYGIGIEEIKQQYDYKIIPSMFMDKYSEYLV